MVSEAAGQKSLNLTLAGAALGLLILGIPAVLGLPHVAHALPHPGRVDQSKYAVAAAGLLVLTAAFVFIVEITTPRLGRSWSLWTLAYGTCLITVKFVLSPIAFQKESGTSLSSFVSAGLVVMPLYAAALSAMYLIAKRKSGGWPMTSKLGYSAALALVAVGIRLLVALVLGTASQYIDNLWGTGITFPILVALASYCVMQSFDQLDSDSRRSALNVGTLLVIVQHALWIVYMNALFS